MKLSPKEYDILEQLVIHAGKVLKHKHLLREVWRDETSIRSICGSTSASCARRSRWTRRRRARADRAGHRLSAV